MTTIQDRSRTEDLCGARIIHHDQVARAREQVLVPAELEGLASMFKALGDPTRLRIVMALADGIEMCVCDLAAFLEVSESAVSHQLRRLKDLHLVRRRRQGQCLYYALDDDHVAGLLQIGLAHVRE
ncbi:MAG: metalloregulator ArsR/SmtB family transcription factor [Proteobacteria bacterium]|nr:metalloregulator ArsR/SmtB family transcription factor [Pseudomonadota bacterium]